MDKRQKVAHLLRRLGLGASFSEMEFYEKLGVEGTIDRLINYEKVDEGFDVSLMAFSYKNQDGRVVIQPPAVSAHWLVRMLVTQRPLQEKLTLFWHDHFAISASKVNQPPMLWQYVETLRKNAIGDFDDLLLAASQDAAMIRWLDNDTNVKGKPNENFAREIMELFSLGIGNYTEKDIQEAARAFTGWNFRVNLAPGAARNAQRLGPIERVSELIDKNEPVYVFQLRQAQHDTGMKSVLGNEGAFDGVDICGILAGHPQTARYIPSKLWEWFAYEKPEPKIVDRLAKVYTSSGMNIRKVLFAIVESDEFWSDKCVRKLVKNPVDFTVATCRMLGLGKPIYDQLKARTADDSGTRAAGQPMRALDQLLDRQGMRLLYPPDVAGWDWGAAWISSATMVERIKLADFLFAQGPGFVRGAKGPFAAGLISGKPNRTSEEVVDSILQVFDANVTPDRRRVLIQACTDAGGPAAATDPRRADRLFLAVCRLLFAAPEHQFC